MPLLPMIFLDTAIKPELANSRWMETYYRRANNNTYSLRK